ncbi:hypothetical protein BAUCODRAFT_467715 [Baudoinia panamericana UAMH 10762]|uniref:Myocyte-specific enhancer factor 2d n=1 Tax=Baudoinia panamericana (strain UAMH 10762) TaxID=717646 RepID=M2NAR9_BAUPA|nr:uncharacterized protein BAUCODRAFT_467715 [Baudoinia panamericana UAMH 10762]EMC96239.1 hypothetical protein BAUCODRAFT_467715 [Baudoinia panamericana UAMH 10762]
MNLGSIPGYYYDAEKQKYFKVQADHVVPTGAKYAHSEVKREQRQSKKRKVVTLQQERRLKQTVQRARMHDSLTALGLRSELGLREITGVLADRDAAFVANLRPRRRRVWVPTAGCRIAGTVQDFQTFHRTQNVIAYSNQHYGTSVFFVEGPPYKDSSKVGSSGQTVNQRINSWPCIAFNSSLVNLHVVPPDRPIYPHGTEGETPLLIAVAREPKSPGNVYLGGPHTSQSMFRLGELASWLWASSLHPATLQLAVSGSDDVFILDTATASVAHCLDIPYESRDIAWLNRNTVAFGTQPWSPERMKPSQKAKVSEKYALALWDLRSHGQSFRFLHALPLTGIRMPDKEESNVQILVSDNRRIDLYDTRMAKSPLLGFDHTHQGPQIELDVSPNGDLVAALDVGQVVQTYSLRSGRHVEALPQPQSHDTAMMTKLRWNTRSPGEVPSLQACQGGSIVEWSWSPTEEDAEDC